MSEEPRRWDELLGRARVAWPGRLGLGRLGALALVDELAGALEEERDNRDSAQEYSKHQEAALTEARQEIARLSDKLHEAEIENSAPLRERVRGAVRDALAYDSMSIADSPDSDVERVIDAVLPVIATEVSARASEAQVAVPEPFGIGEVCDVVVRYAETKRAITDIGVRIQGEAVAHALNLDDRVGLWPASLAEQVAEAQQDELGLQDELDAMTAVARRFKRGDEVLQDDEGRDVWWEPGTPIEEPPPLVTDAERRALQSLSEGESE